ncbi:hypothetical protein Lal_00002001 [Lupinus albus]|nr:hypothetical protein Lal_00002001 [Lupinus albus]
MPFQAAFFRIAHSSNARLKLLVRLALSLAIGTDGFIYGFAIESLTRRTSCFFILGPRRAARTTRRVD